MRLDDIQTTCTANVFCRPATNKDAEDIRNIIYSNLIKYGLEPEPGATDADLYDIESHYSEGTFWVLIDSQNTIKGSFALWKYDENTVELRKMYFHSSIKGLGLGHWVMNYVEFAAAKLGFTKIYLETAAVLGEAVELYHKHDYLISNKALHSQRCDIYMEKLL